MGDGEEDVEVHDPGETEEVGFPYAVAGGSEIKLNHRTRGSRPAEASHPSRNARSWTGSEGVPRQGRALRRRKSCRRAAPPHTSMDCGQCRISVWRGGHGWGPRARLSSWREGFQRRCPFVRRRPGWTGQERRGQRYSIQRPCAAVLGGMAWCWCSHSYCDRLEDDIRHKSSQLPTTSPTCSPRDNISSQVPAQRPAFSRSRAGSLRPRQADPPPRLSHAALSLRFEKDSSSTLDGSGCAALLHSLIYLKLVPPREAHCLRTREPN